MFFGWCLPVSVKLGLVLRRSLVAIADHPITDDPAVLLVLSLRPFFQELVSSNVLAGLADLLHHALRYILQRVCDFTLTMP